MPAYQYFCRSAPTFSAPIRACMLPNGLTGPRVGRPRIVRSDDSFQICRFSKRNLASIGIGLAITTLLLLIFAYQGGTDRGSWFSNLLVMVSVLAFVFFGPLFLCLCYYRQLQMRQQVSEVIRNMRVESGTQTSSSSETRILRNSNSPQLYTCIIIAPGAADFVSNDSRYSGLPNYEDALANSTPRVHSDKAGNETSLESGLRDESAPPPTYNEAINILSQSTSSNRDELCQSECSLSGAGQSASSKRSVAKNFKDSSESKSNGNSLTETGSGDGISEVSEAETSEKESAQGEFSTRETTI